MKTNYSRPAKFDLAYQLKRHVDQMMQRWPALDRETTIANVKRLLINGEAWLYPEPQQLELFA